MRTFLIGVLVVALAGGALAQEPEGQASSARELYSAYQTGYFQLVAISCFQLYSTTGIIVTDFSEGNIDAATALTALEQNSLLHSACTTTLARIRGLTPPEDAAVLEEAARLDQLLVAQGDLMAALEEYFLTPDETNASLVESRLEDVENALESYAGS